MELRMNVYIFQATQKTFETTTFRLMFFHGSQCHCGSNDLPVWSVERGWKIKPDKELPLTEGCISRLGRSACLSPGSLDETHSSPRGCSDPWVWWPAHQCGGHTQPLRFHMAQTQTQGCSRGTRWTAAFSGSHWQLCRNWPEETKWRGLHCSPKL